MILKNFIIIGKKKFLKENLIMINSLPEVKVEIVLPNYNSAPYLEETIKSIINQTFKNWKLTIVDANSNMLTKKVLEKYSVHEKINILWLKKK